MRSTKSPSKYTSLAKLQEIASNWYRGADGQDYEASEVDALIIAKADKISDEMMADYYDYCDDYEAAQDADYQHEISDSLLVCAVASCGDGTLLAGACADWSALVAEAAVSHFFTCGLLVVYVRCSLSMNHKKRNTHGTASKNPHGNLRRWQARGNRRSSFTRLAHSRRCCRLDQASVFEVV